jgi:hypothetical protein
MLVRNRITGQLHDVPAHLLYGAYDDTYDGFGFPIAALIPAITSVLPMVTDLIKGITGGAQSAAPPPPEHEPPAPEPPRRRRASDDAEPQSGRGPAAPTEVVYVPVRRPRRRRRGLRRVVARPPEPLNGYGPLHGYYGNYPW